MGSEAERRFPLLAQTPNVGPDVRREVEEMIDRLPPPRETWEKLGPIRAGEIAKRKGPWREGARMIALTSPVLRGLITSLEEGHLRRTIQRLKDDQEQTGVRPYRDLPERAGPRTLIGERLPARTAEEQRLLDQALVHTALMEAAELEQRGETWPKMISEGVMRLYPYMLEFFLTSGMAQTASAPVKEAVGALAARYGTTKARRLAIQAVGALAERVPRAAVRAPLWTAELAAERQKPVAEITPEGRVEILKPGATPAKAWLLAYKDAFIEAYSEETGELITGAGGRVLARVPVVGKAAKAISGKLKALAARFPGGVNRAFGQAGYSSFIGEMAEEHVAALLHAATDIEPPRAGDESSWSQRMSNAVWPGWKPMGVRAAVLTIPGVARAGAGMVVPRAEDMAERLRALPAAEAGALGPQPPEGAEPPALPVEPEKPADLLGRPTKPEMRQAPLWSKKGIEAVWRTVKGVEYVLTEDGMYATRADGTGPLIPKEDGAALAADAEKVKPPAPAAVKPAVPKTIADLRRLWPNRNFEWIGSGADKALDVSFGTSEIDRRRWISSAQSRGDAAEQVAALHRYLQSLEPSPPEAVVAKPPAPPVAEAVPEAVAPPEKPPEAPPVAVPEPEAAPELTRESKYVERYMKSLRVGGQAKFARMAGIDKVPKVATALKTGRRAAKYRRDVEKRALDLGLEKYEAQIGEGEGVATTPILNWLPYKIPVAKGTEHSAEIMEALEGRPEAKKYFAIGERVGGGIDELADMAIDAPDSGFKGRSVSDFLDAVIAEADAAAALQPAREDFADRLRTVARNIPEDEARQLTDLAEVWEGAVAKEQSAEDTVHDVMLPLVTSEVVEATKLVEKLRGMTERAEKAEAETVERAGEVRREQERAARARKAERDVSAKLAETRREIAALQQERGKGVAPLVRAAEQLLKGSALTETTRRKLLARMEKIATPDQMRGLLTDALRATETQLKAGLQQRVEKAAGGIWTHKEEFDRRLPENRRLLDEAKSSRKLSKERVRNTSIDKLTGLAGHLETGLFQHQTREKMLASLQEDKVSEVASGIVSGLPPRRFLSAAAPGEQPRAPVERRARRVLAHTLKPGRLIRRYVGKPESPGYEVLYQAPIVEGGHNYCVEMNGLDDAWSSMVKEATGTDADSPKFGDWLFEVVRAPGCPPMERRVLATLLGQMRDPHSRAFEPRTGFNLHTDLSGPVHRLALKDVSVLEAWVKKNDPALDKLVKAAHDYYNRPEHLEKLSAVSKQLSGREVQRVKSWWYSPRNVTKKIELRPMGTPRDLAQQSTAGHMGGRVPKPRSPLILHPMDSIFFRLGNMDAGFLAYALPLRDANAVLNVHVPVRLGQDLPLYRYLERKLGKSVVREAQGNLASIYKSLGMMTGVNARTYSLAARWARKQMLRMGKAITWINPRMLGRQVVGTLVSWSDPKAPPAKCWRRAAREVFTHPVRSIREVQEKVPEVKYRHQGGGLIYNYISGGTADPRVLLSSRKAIRHMQILGEKHGPMMLKIGDALGQAVRYRACYESLQDKGLRGKELETEAAKLTVHLMTEWDFPSTFGNLSGLERAARESIFMRGLTWFRITRGNVFCGLLEIFDDVADVHRTGGDMRPLLKRLTKWIIAAIAMAGLSAVYGLSRRKTRSVAGFSEEAAWGIADSSLGHIPAAGKLVSTIKWSRPGGPQIETAPFMRPMEDTLGGMMGLFAAIDKADPDRAYRATIRMSSALALMLGVPIVGPRNVWRVIFPTGKRPSGRAEKILTKKRVALLWKASGTGAGAAAAAGKLREAGVTLAQARARLSDIMRAEGVTGAERRKRLWRLSNRWHAATRRDEPFRRWARRYGVKNPDDPRHHYDYRAAWRAGTKPRRWRNLPKSAKAEDLRQVAAGQRTSIRKDAWMWPDKYKQPGHEVPAK